MNVKEEGKRQKAEGSGRLDLIKLSASLSLLPFAFFLFVNPAFAKPRLPHGPIQGKTVNDLPAPSNLRAEVTHKTITLTWDWQAPEQLPEFTDFGFEVKRSDGRTALVAGTTYSDMELAFGSYTYTVRVRGGEKIKSRILTHVSDWSESAGGTIQVACPQAPAVTLTVEPTRKTYGSIPSLRLHLTGQVTVPEGCHLLAMHYHLDSGAGIVHSGPLKPDEKGNFDAFVNAIGPDDEIPAGSATFSITATAEDENGPTTSSAYSLTIQLRNPFAPHDPDQL